MKNIKWNYMMSNLILSIEDRGGARSTSFSGRREGREVRKKHNLDEKDKDDNIDNEPMNFFDDSDDDIFKSIIDTSYEYLDDDFIKNIQKRFV